MFSELWRGLPQYLTPAGYLLLLIPAFQLNDRVVWLVCLGLISASSALAWLANLRRYRAIADTPTSRIGTAAQGFVELSGVGKPLPGMSIVSPARQLPCLWYRYKAYELRNSEWAQIDSGESDAEFLLDDGSGLCLMRPYDAEVVSDRKDTYRQGDINVTALNCVSLDIQVGEFLVLMGPSGSGKSTLLHMIGLLERPTSGHITIAGKAIAGLDEASMTELRGRSLGFVFQFHHLLPEFSALENVMMPTLIDQGRYDGKMRERARWLLAKVGLGDDLDKLPSALSGGMQQRVAIARALAMNPPLVLADEPTGNLDTHTADEVFELLRDFNREEGSAFLIVTHDPRLAARCDRRIDLTDGQIQSHPT